MKNKGIMVGLLVLVFGFIILGCDNGTTTVEKEVIVEVPVEVPILDDSIDHITIINPVKTGYHQYGIFSSEGLVVKGHYTDGSVVTVNSGYTLSWNGQSINDGNSTITADLGEKIVTVNWRDKIKTFSIVVSAGNNIQVTNTSQWLAALNQISTGGNNQDYVITVSGNIEVSGSTSASFGTVSNVSVVLRGNGKLFLNSQGNILRIANYCDQTLFIDSADLTLEGIPNNNQAIIYVGYNAKLELLDGVIRGNTNTNTNGAGGISSSGDFVMSGGIISGNTVQSDNGGGGGVSSSGNFIMSGGIIRGNICTGSFSGGGGVFSSGDFVMSGGIISGNTVQSDNGGGVYAFGGSFSKTGGIIYGTDAVNIEDKNVAGSNTQGHAAYYYYTTIGYYHNSTLSEYDNLSTSDTLPVNTGETLNGWTKR